MVGIANPLFDQAAVPIAPGLSIAAGWLSFLSIVLRFLLTTAAALLLVASTGMPAIAEALRQLRLPAVFVTQLQLLYRYLFLLGDEALRMERARDLRSCGRRGTGLWVGGTLLGALLLRTLARATRIHDAMLLRGFGCSCRPPPRMWPSAPRTWACRPAWCSNGCTWRWSRWAPWPWGTAPPTGCPAAG